MATTLSVARDVRRPQRNRPRATRRLLLKLSWIPFVVPGLGMFLVFEVWPLIQAIVLSLYQWDGYSKKVYVGGANYRRALSDATFWHALGHAGIYTACTVTGKMVIGLGLALLLHRQLVGRAFFRSVVFAPVLMSFVAVGLLWQLIYSPGQGLMNRVLGLLHLPAHVNWLGNPHIALFSLVLVDLWKYIGYHTILFLAGLTLVQKELTEAAVVDGASAWQQFWHVTLPAIRPIAVVNLVIATAGAINTFDLVYVMTNGGPFGVTELPITFMYRQGFSNSQFGYASAIACVMFVVVGIITVLILRLQRSDGDK